MRSQFETGIIEADGAAAGGPGRAIVSPLETGFFQAWLSNSSVKHPRSRTATARSPWGSRTSQGGPACEGLTIAKVEERIMPDKTSRGMYFSDTEMHFVCPWHGMEYDMKTGECVSDRRMKLRKYKILQKGDDVYVVA